MLYAGKQKWMVCWCPYRPREMPPVPACYVIQIDGKTIYVGQTLNLRARFYSHRIKPIGDGYKTAWGHVIGDFLGLKVKLGSKYGDWAMREARLVNRLMPMFNLRRC